MPPSHIERWSTLLDEAEALTRLGTRALELVRGRLWLQTSWEADAAHFGDVPWPLAQKSQRLLRLITHRLAAANREATAVDPNLFWWPLSPVVVTSPWGHRTHPIHGDYRFHAGVDLEAELEQPVFAAGPGIVAFAGWNAGHGKYIALQHGARLSTTYSHLDGFSVQNGDTVRRGDLIGFAGQTGAATGVHLHFELRRDGEPLDPEDILGAGAFGRRVSAR
jgi:murein DD-endopeptidase MepM/ murein hydrolase activator NlpD